MNTSGNLLKYLTTDPSGPMLLPVSARVFRRKLASMGFLYVQKRKVIFAERSKPYIVRWKNSYCERRTARLHPEGEQRPRIWIDASFINKHDTRGLGALWPFFRITKGPKQTYMGSERCGVRVCFRG